MIKIGVSATSYLEQRNFIDLLYSKPIQFIKKKDLYKPYNHIIFRLFNRINPDTHFTFKDHFFNRNIDLYHLFGSIYFGKKPWIVTSDVILPRWYFNKEKAYQALSKDNCKKIIFLSEIVFNRQLAELNSYPKYRDSISKKMVILHPSQRPLINHYSEKKLGEKISFIITGHRILGKGGLEILKVFEKLYQQQNNFELIIISKLHVVDFLYNEKTNARLEEVKSLIQKYQSKFISYQPELPNAKVLERMKNSHVALLPSYDDTYGFTVLEAQACGCPIVTTDILAFPEINNNEIGWILEVPKTEFGRPDAFTLEKYSNFSTILEEKLLITVSDILKNPDSIEKKGVAALNHIISTKQPQKNAEYLENLYTDILNFKI